MNVTAAFPVTEASQIGEPRRAVQRLASRLGFSEQDAGRAALVLSELATNLAKHGRGGELLLDLDRSLSEAQRARARDNLRRYAGDFAALAARKGP